MEELVSLGGMMGIIKKLEGLSNNTLFLQSIYKG
jgi:hypothetical protein